MRNTRYVDVYGDHVAIVFQPHSGRWLSPAHGETFIAPRDAMRAELRAYMLSCGVDPDSAPAADEIEHYLTEIVEG